MLSWLFHTFGRYWGPLRLFDSFFFLSAVGFATAAESDLLHVKIVLLVEALRDPDVNEG